MPSTRTDVTGPLLRLLGDPVRARIVAALAREELCVCHLVDETSTSQPNVSNHLRVLREAGLVESESAGRFTYYRLVPARLYALSAALSDLAVEASRAKGRKRPC